MLCGTACFFVRLFVVLARFCFRFGVQPVAFHMRSGMFHNKTVLSAFCCRRFDKSLTLL